MLFGLNVFYFSKSSSLTKISQPFKCSLKSNSLAIVLFGLVVHSIPLQCTAVAMVWWEQKSCPRRSVFCSVGDNEFYCSPIWMLSATGLLQPTQPAPVRCDQWDAGITESRNQWEWGKTFTVRRREGFYEGRSSVMVKFRWSRGHQFGCG